MKETVINTIIALAKEEKGQANHLSSSRLSSDDITDLLTLSLLESHKINDLSKQFEIELQPLLLRYIEENILRNPRSDWQALGLGPQDDPQKIEQHYLLLVKLINTKFTNSEHQHHYLRRISDAYKHLKAEDNNSEFKNITLSSVPPKTYYQHRPQNDSTAFSLFESKNVLLALAGFVLLAVFFSLHTIQQETDTTTLTKKSTAPHTRLANSSFSEISHSFNISQLKSTNNTIDKKAIYKVVQKLEGYYEKGDVQKIKPILAQSPDIQNQTDEQIQSKLETLFRITQNRKMLFYDFNWQYISGNYIGNGKFLSRYQMVNDDDWKIRTGKAKILATDKPQNTLKIIGIQLENGNIE